MATKSFTAVSHPPVWRTAGAALASLAGLGVMASAGGAWGQANADTSARTTDNVLAPVSVPGEKRRDHDPAKLDHIMPEVSGAQITVTKKATVTKLDQQPTIIDNNQRQLFNKSPGLLVTEQNTPDQFNLSYRGLGNPQESEFVLVLQDGIPIASDWIGFPTLYYMPLPQSISEVQLIRGGASLIYGPEPAPAVNFVSRRPTPGEPMTGYTEQVGGSHGLYSTYNVLEGTSGNFEYRAEAGYSHSDGERDNAKYDLGQVNLYLGWRPTSDSLWYLDLKAYQVSAGNPGKISITQYNADPDFAPTPFNHDWVDRYSATLGHTQEFGDGWRLETKAWMSYTDLTSRATNPVPGTGTTLQQDLFQNEGADVRVRKRWGRGNAFTAGFVAYHSNGPFRRWNDADVQADHFDHTGPIVLDENRSTDYGAIFAENVFRFGSFHIVPSARLDYERVKVDELVKPATAHYFIDTDINKTIPMFAIGFGNDFGHNNETYFNVSQGWRPVRYFDVASPFGNTLPGTGPDPSKSLSWEAGVHGTPVPGLFYDIGVFWIDFKNRIETLRGLGPTGQDSIAINSGDTRHRGVEGELSYDFLARRGGDQHLLAFGNFALLDATFTDSAAAPANIGNTPAFAPHAILKGGLTWRKDKAYDISVTGQYVSSQYFQDSNVAATSAGVVTVPAKIPGYTVFDLAGDYYITRNVRLTGGVSNMFAKKYYSRVFQNGIEPAPGRAVYAGIALGF